MTQLVPPEVSSCSRRITPSRDSELGTIGSRLSALLIIGALSLLIGGAFATFTDEVPAGPQAITSGTVKLATGPKNDAATGATNIAAGDTIAREIDLNSTGTTIPDQKVTLQFWHRQAPCSMPMLPTDSRSASRHAQRPGPARLLALPRPRSPTPARVALPQ